MAGDRMLVDDVTVSKHPSAQVSYASTWTWTLPHYSLPGLEPSVIPILPATKRFTVEKKTYSRLQFPMTESYAFTDYRAQGQTIKNVIVDIARPTGGTLTLANVYVALSRSSGRDTIRLLRPFDVDVLLQPLDENLQVEDTRLSQLNRQTKLWWHSVRDR